MVAVARGKVSTRGDGVEHRLAAGDGATLGGKSAPQSGGLAAAFGWSEHLETIPVDEKDAHVPGLGVLRARQIGDERFDLCGGHGANIVEPVAARDDNDVS